MESYNLYIDRIKPNPLAVAVKIADLEDNMDLTRYPLISSQDKDRLDRYRSAWDTLIQLRISYLRDDAEISRPNK
jgi:hypothetical protein